MPSQLHGGIKGRRMSDISTGLQIQIDNAKRVNEHFVGLKLDKSKCFDRLIPSVSSALFAALGIPSFVINFFLQLYTNLKRFMTYKTWIAENYTTCSNGLVQGCSFSLLAINAHMCIWSIFMSRLPYLQAKIFIDDSYLWSPVSQLKWLVEAIRITEQWDNLVGQSLNTRKCEVFGTNKNARKLAAITFPSMKQTRCVEVLGAKIRITDESNFFWPEFKTSKISRDIALIKAIPCSREIHEHIIAAKVVPQLTFAPMINDIPLKTLQKLQDQISDCLWKGRPMWRCKWLLLGILSKPHRVDPVLSRAYGTIMETIHFLKQASPTERHMWEGLTSAPLASRVNLLQHFLQACSIIQIDFHPPFHLSIFNSEPVCFLDFARRDLKKVIQFAIRHVCYLRATKLPRKDTKSCSGFLDFDLSVAGTTVLKQQWHNFVSMFSFWESAMVGCSITNDRCCAAGFSETSDCRFCGSVKETFEHLTCCCTRLPTDLQRPTFDTTEFGPNFATLGLVEVSCDQIQYKLHNSQTSQLSVSPWSSDASDWNHVWTDGSCAYQESFWDTIGAYAVISNTGAVLSSGCVRHWVLSSYSCELWAGIAAWAHASSPLVIHSDCKAFVEQTKIMLQTKQVDKEWPHQEWWNFFLSLVLLRTSTPESVLRCEWCPAHVLEHLPVEHISPQVAKDFHTTIENIRWNRKADRVAKQVLFTSNKIFRNTEDCLAKVSAWHLWIAKVNSRVSELSKKVNTPQSHNGQCVHVENIPQTFVAIEDLTVWHNVDAFARLLPKWQWFPSHDDFSWRADFPIDTSPSKFVNLTLDDWKVGLDFLTKLSWDPNPSGKTSYIELAYDAWHKGFHFPNTNPNPKCYATVIRKICNQSKKVSNLALYPGTQKSGCSSRGKTLPAGYITANALLSSLALKSLAVVVLKGRSQKLKEWEQPF